jgi:hypothetical protein
MSSLNKLVVAGMALGCMGIGTGCLALTQEEQADIMARCQQEAEDYAIPQEQLADYIDGCVLAMGGYPMDRYEDEPDGEEPPVPVEGEVPEPDDVGGEYVP